MKGSRFRHVAALVVVITLLVAPVAFAQQAECTGDRVIDPERWLDEGVVREFDTQSRNLDQHDIRLYLYSAHTDDVVSGNYVGELARELIAQGECGMGSDTVVIGIAPGIDPEGQYKDFGVTEIWYGSDALRDRMEALKLVGHTDNIMLELSNRVDASVVANTYNDGLMPAVRDFASALNTLLSAVQPTAVVVVTVNVAPTQPPSPTQVPVPPKPVDLRPLFAVLGVLVVIAIVIVGVIAFVAYNEANKKRRAVQRNAQSAALQVSRTINDWPTRMQETELAIELIGDVDPSEKAPLKAKLTEADNEVGSVAEQNTSLRGRKDHNADAPNLTEAEYTKIAAAYTTLLTELRAAHAKADEVKRSAVTMRQTVGDAAKFVAGATTAIEQSAQRIAAVEQQGFRVTDAQEILAQARANLTLAQTALTAKRYSKAAAAAADAQQQAEDAAEEAEDLPEEKKRLNELHGDLEAQIKALATRLVGAPDAMAELSVFNRATHSDLQGNVQEAHNRVDWATQNLVDMQGAITEQDFEDAQAEYDQAVAWLNEVGTLLDAIANRKAQILEAKEKLPSVLHEAHSSVETALAAILKHDTVMPESKEHELQAAIKELMALRSSLGGEQPDYITILRRARELDSLADAVLAQTNTAAQQEARFKGRLDEVLREARSSIAAAEKYMQAHAGDIDASTLKYLMQAREELRAAEAELEKLDTGRYEESDRVKAWEKTNKHALAADTAADKALAVAKQDVKEAEAARRTYSSYSPSYGSGYGSSRDDGDTTVVVVNNTYGGWGDRSTDRPNREERRSSGGSGSGTRASRDSSPSGGSSSGTRASRPSTPSYSSPSSSGTRASRPSSPPSYSRPSSSPTRSSPSISRPSSSGGGTRARR